MGAEVALDLRSKTSSRDVISELAVLVRRVQKSDFGYAHYCPLVRLVIQNASDFEIWNAVLNLIATLSRATPASVPSVFDDMPITHSSASQQGGGQSRELVKKRLFEEIRSCTYRDVGRVLPKYFEGMGWTTRTLDIYQAMKNRHKDGRWTDFPIRPCKPKLWTGGSNSRKNFSQRSEACTTRQRARKTWSALKLSVKLISFVKPNDGPTSDSAHDWKDVGMIGELKESNRDKKGKLLQIGRYVRDVFSCQPTRRYVHAFYNMWV